MSIRYKVILPYLLLTLLVIGTGLYVVTRLVASSLGERLTNQLLEAGRVVSDEVANQEADHLKAAQFIAYTRGLAEAVRDGNQSQVVALARPAARGMNVGYVAILGSNGRSMFQVERINGGPLTDAIEDPAITGLSIVQTLLNAKDSNAMPQRQLGVNGAGVQFYFSAINIVDENRQAVGVIVVGAPLDAFLIKLKNTSLADVTFYWDSGLSLASTFVPSADAGNTEGKDNLERLSITPQAYQEAFDKKAKEFVTEENLTQNDREYRVTRGSLAVGEDRLGVFSVALPLNFVIQSAENSRTTYFYLFFAATALVILLGWYIAGFITRPLGALVGASQAIADGDLTKRTEVQSNDELGSLSSAFNTMTEKLQQRTEELKNTNRILEQMDLTKGNFIRISAHELRTPLTLMQGYAQILEQRAKKEPDLAPVAKGILEGSNRMYDVVNSMLDVSKIDSKTLTIAPTAQNFNTIMSKLQNSFKSAIEDRKQNLTVNGIEDLPPVNMDGELMYKVFYNILVNAIKFTPDGGTIVIRGRTVNENGGQPEVEVSIHDTGIGIDEKNHEAVFEKFYQEGEVMLHSSGKTKFKGGGPGLGLAIAHGIVEAHHGKIWVESPGHDEVALPGSTFYVRLPVNGIVK